MTLSEFKAWFEGFTEDMDGAPNKKQWDRIKARVKEIDGVAVTKTVFVDRYLPPYRPYWEERRIYGSVGVVDNSTYCANAMTSQFNNHAAMLDLGKAEYSAAVAA